MSRKDPSNEKRPGSDKTRAIAEMLSSAPGLENLRALNLVEVMGGQEAIEKRFAAAMDASDRKDAVRLAAEVLPGNPGIQEILLAADEILVWMRGGGS